MDIEGDAVEDKAELTGLDFVFRKSISASNLIRNY